MVGADVPGGPPPARNAAGRPTTEPRVGVGCRRARGTRAPTNVGVLIRQGQPTWEARSDAMRRGRLGYFARQAVAGRLWIWPWVGCWLRAAQGPAATSAALPCGRGCRGRAISRRNSSAGAIHDASAREVPAPPSARDVQADPAQGPATTSAALPCGRGAGDARFHVGTVPPGRYAARRRAKYPRRPRRGTSKQARRRARPRQARPSRVAEGVGDAGFHVGAVPK